MREIRAKFGTAAAYGHGIRGKIGCLFQSLAEIATIGKSLVFIAAILTGSLAAAPAEAQNSKFEGTYLGAYLSYSSINTELTTSAGSLGDATLDGFGGGVLAGYGGTNDWLYISFEVEAGYDGAQWSESETVAGVGSASLDLQTKASLGVSGRIGAVVAKNYLFYGKIGYVRTNAEATGQLNLVGVGSSSATVDDWYDGFRFGGGVKRLHRKQYQHPGRIYLHGL